MKMYKQIYLLISLFFSISIFAKTGKVVISGNVKNITTPNIGVSHISHREIIKVNLDENGHFTMSFNVAEGFYLLEYGRNSSFIYLYPNDKLEVTFNAKEFEKTLIFSGKGAEKNNYLVKKSLNDQELKKDFKTFYSKDENAYLKNLEAAKNSHLNLLKTYSLEDDFKFEEQKSLEYQRLLGIQNFKSNYKFYLGEEITPSKKFYKPLKYFNVNKELEYEKQPYYRYLTNSLWNKKIRKAKGVDGKLGVLRNVRSNLIVSSLIYNLYYEISEKNDDAKVYLDIIKKVARNKRFKDAAQKRYDQLISANKLINGVLSPSFQYEDIDGKFVKLSDLKGKYVYIDIWATWCGGCIAQLPYLKKLEEKYDKENITFVSISVDKIKAKAAWKKMVEDKEMGGLQLFADNSFDSEFIIKYAVNSIPRFILIDPEGRIVESKAPSPSFEKTKVLLDKFLKK